MKQQNNPTGSDEQNRSSGAGEDSKDRGKPAKDKKHEKKDDKNVGENDEPQELPSKEREEKPYIGDNPEETKRQAPKMK